MQQTPSSQFSNNFELNKNDKNNILRKRRSKLFNLEINDKIEKVEGKEKEMKDENLLRQNDRGTTLEAIENRNPGLFCIIISNRPLT